DTAQDVAGIVLLAIPLVAAWLRRWDVVALSLGLIVSTVPYGATLLGVGQRYLYFSTPVLAVLAGVLVSDTVAWVRARFAQRIAGERMALAGGAGLLLACGAGAAVTFDRIEHWMD